MGIVEEDSSLNKPKVLVGRIQHYDVITGEATLLWYRNTNSNLYALELDGSMWTENANSFHHVTMIPATKTPGLYKLKNSLRTLHKKVFDK